MLVDARNLPTRETLQADVCVIGAGPAGITLAREFNGLGLAVLLLESGGFDPDPAVTALSDGENVGEPYIAPDAMRERVVGGTASVWPVVLDNGRFGAMLVPLDPIDFEKRDWVPHSGWPINRADLDPFYERAHRVAQSGPYDYAPSSWEEPGATQLPFDQHRVDTRMFQFGPRDVFTEAYRRELERSADITLLIYAHALELETDELAGAVTGVRVGALGGNQFNVAAKFVVLAQGGLETARLLLLSDAVQTGGLGNGYDLVGRFLMDHPVIGPGIVKPSDRSIIDRLALYDARWVKGARVLAKPALSESIQRQEKLLNFSTAIFPRPAWVRHSPLRRVFPRGMRPSSPALHSARALFGAVKNRKLPANALKHLRSSLSGIDDLLYFSWRSRGRSQFQHLPIFSYHFEHGGWSRLANKAKKFGCFELLHITEQSPDPGNRLTLSEDRDAFGCRKMSIHWRYSDFDKRSVKRAMEIFAEECESVGLGHTRLDLDHGEPIVWKSSIHHPMGTTRMHESPKHGVVDADCRVHGVSNLFIASSSVFPTGGYANPTLTVLALALRLADHLKVKMNASELKTMQMG